MAIKKRKTDFGHKQPVALLNPSNAVKIKPSMLPPVVIVDSVEMIRDGGSLAAIFHGGDSCEYWLFFEIRMSNSKPNVAERLGYSEPKIVNRHTSTEVGIAWEHAAMMLRQIEKLTHRDHDRLWLKKMQTVADSRGTLPNEIERFMPSFRLDELA